MDAKTIGDVTLYGWWDKAASGIARRSPFADDVVRALLGVAFFATSARYVVRALRAANRELRR